MSAPPLRRTLATPADFGRTCLSGEAAPEAACGSYRGQSSTRPAMVDTAGRRACRAASRRPRARLPLDPSAQPPTAAPAPAFRAAAPDDRFVVSPLEHPLLVAEVSPQAAMNRPRLNAPLVRPERAGATGRRADRDVGPACHRGHGSPRSLRLGTDEAGRRGEVRPASLARRSLEGVPNDRRLARSVADRPAGGGCEAIRLRADPRWSIPNPWPWRRSW